MFFGPTKIFSSASAVGFVKIRREKRRQGLICRCGLCPALSDAGLQSESSLALLFAKLTPALPKAAWAAAFSFQAVEIAMCGRLR